MRIDPLGERTLILRDLPGDPFAVAAALQLANLVEIEEIVPAYETIGLYLSANLDTDKIHLAVKDLPETTPLQKHHTIPACYDLGEDMESVCRALRLSRDQVIRAHTNGKYRCYAMGFRPGFPYLRYLEPPIDALPRLADPRLHVPAGSVAITGRQTGIYPCDGPGGWNLIARTPLTIANADEDYFPIQASDTIQFEAIDLATYQDLLGQRL